MIIGIIRRATKLFTPMEPEDKKAAAVEGRLQRAEKRRRINTNEDGDIVPAKNKKKAKKEVEKPDVAKTVVEKPDTAKKEAVIVNQATTAVTNDKNKDKNGQKHKKLDLLKDRGAEKQPQNTESDSEEEDVSKKRAKFLEKQVLNLLFVWFINYCYTNNSNSWNIYLTKIMTVFKLGPVLNSYQLQK